MKTPEQNIVDTLTGKKVLFLENDNSLDNGLDIFRDILADNGIAFKILYQLSEMKVEAILKEINKADAIVFQTQWVYPIAKKLQEYMLSLPQKKIVVEVYISEPTWYYAHNHGSIHDVYIFSQLKRGWDEPKFYKLTDKAYWDYKNNFDK